MFCFIPVNKICMKNWESSENFSVFQFSTFFGEFFLDGFFHNFFDSQVCSVRSTEYRWLPICNLTHNLLHHQCLVYNSNCAIFFQTKTKNHTNFSWNVFSLVQQQSFFASRFPSPSFALSHEKLGFLNFLFFRRKKRLLYKFFSS